jgi:hypothetical protein
LKKPQGLNSGEIKMAVEEKEKQAKAQTDEPAAVPVEDENVSTEDFPNELRLPVWSVISFDKREASGLTYAEAEQKLSELEAQKISGLCIVTDEVGARIAVRN